MSCMRAERREAACAAQAEGEKVGRDDDRAGAAGGGERHARQGNVLKLAEQLRARTAAKMMSKLELQSAASVTPVRAMACTRAKQCEAALPPKPRARKALAEGR